MRARPRGKTAGIAAGALLLVTLGATAFAMRRHAVAWWMLRGIDSAPEARKLEIIESVGRLGSQLAVPKLVEMLDGDEVRKKATLRALISIRPVSETIIPRIARLLLNETYVSGRAMHSEANSELRKLEEELASAAQDVLRGFGPRCIPAIVEGLARKDEGNGGRALERALPIFTAWPREAASCLVDGFSRASESGRLWCLHALVQLGETAVAAIDARIRRAPAEQHAWFAAALARIAAEKTLDCPLMLSLTRMPGARGIAAALDLDSAVETIVAASLVPDEAVSFELACIRSLGLQGQASAAGVPYLVECLSRESRYAVAAQHALVTLGGVAVPALLERLASREHGGWQRAEAVLWEAAMTTESIAPALVERLKSSDEPLRGRIARVLDLAGRTTR